MRNPFRKRPIDAQAACALAMRHLERCRIGYRPICRAVRPVPHDAGLGFVVRADAGHFTYDIHIGPTGVVQSAAAYDCYSIPPWPVGAAAPVVTPAKEQPDGEVRLDWWGLFRALEPSVPAAIDRSPERLERARAEWGLKPGRYLIRPLTVGFQTLYPSNFPKEA